MPKKTQTSNEAIQRQRALSRWDNERRAGPAVEKEQAQIREMSNAGSRHIARPSHCAGKICLISLLGKGVGRPT
jgi:hypothetical protein